MKFIFPQNYNFKNKLLGVFDYSTAIFIISWCIIIFTLLNLIFTNINIKIFLFISLCLPVILLCFSGLNGENIIYVLKYFLKFILKHKLYFYLKN